MSSADDVPALLAEYHHREREAAKVYGQAILAALEASHWRVAPTATLLGLPRKEEQVNRIRQGR